MEVEEEVENEEEKEEEVEEEWKEEEVRRGWRKSVEAAARNQKPFFRLFIPTADRQFLFFSDSLL